VRANRFFIFSSPHALQTTNFCGDNTIFFIFFKKKIKKEFGYNFPEYFFFRSTILFSQVDEEKLIIKQLNIYFLFS